MLVCPMHYESRNQQNNISHWRLPGNMLYPHKMQYLMKNMKTQQKQSPVANHNVFGKYYLNSSVKKSVFVICNLSSATVHFHSKLDHRMKISSLDLSYVYFLILSFFLSILTFNCL